MSATKLGIILIFYLIFSTNYSFASEQNLLEKLMSKNNDEVGIEDLFRKGILSKRPNTREDYSDYYISKKNTYFLNSQLILFEHEYFEKYIGCCVNEGFSLFVTVKGDRSQIENFAEKNECGVYDDEVTSIPRKLLKRIPKIKRPLLIEIRCKQNEVNKQQ